MIDEEIVSETLQTLTDSRIARARRREVSPLRGVRGVPDGEIARLTATLWQDGVDLDRDDGALRRLFTAGWEDGLMAIGLTAAALPDAPYAALELGRTWLGQVDDPLTADALGWFVLGPGCLATQTPLTVLLGQEDAGHPMARRTIVSAGLALTTESLTGPAAAALRERAGTKRVQFVEGSLSPGLAALADATHKDEDPLVRKALRRVLRAWAKDAPDGVAAWADHVRGGLPKVLGDEVKRARRRAERFAAMGDDEEGA